MKLTATLMPDIDFAWQDLPNLREVVNTLREQGPVVPVVYHGERVWLLTSHDAVRDAFSDEEHFASEAAYRVHSEPSMGHTLQCMAGDIHRVNRALVSKPFFPRQIREKIEAVIEPEARRWLERIADQPEVDLVQAYSRPFPFSVITRLLGIPVHDDQLFMEWAVKLIDYPWDPEGALAARAGFDAYMVPLIARRRLIFPAGSDTAYILPGLALGAARTGGGAESTVGALSQYRAMRRPARRDYRRRVARPAGVVGASARLNRITESRRFST